MSRRPIPLSIPDLSVFARQTAVHLRPSTPPGHVEMLNILARAAGFRNFQHLRAADAARTRLESAPLTDATDHALVERALRHFDAAGVLARWPARRNLQTLCLWVMWSRFPKADALHERQVNALLAPLHGFGDPALIRRDMIGLGLLTRSPDGRDYRRREIAPPAEALALIRHITRRIGPPT